MSVPGLQEVVMKYQPKADGPWKLFLMEFALHGLAEFSLLSKHSLERGLQFKDLLSSMFTMPDLDDEEEDDDRFDI